MSFAQNLVKEGICVCGTGAHDHIVSDLMASSREGRQPNPDGYLLLPKTTPDKHAGASADGCYSELMTSIELRWTTELTPVDYADMAALFDSEYADEWGPWDPKQGYGYAQGELHALARRDGQLLGYAASARRFIGVGTDELLIAGTGGVLTRKDARGIGVGRKVLLALQDTSRSCAPADFGLLGCREEVVTFYESCGYTRIHSLILDVSPRDAMTVVRSHGPTMICAGTRSADDWPEGTIDLRGLPW